MEVTGGGAETLEIDVEGLVGNEVCAPCVGELKAGLDGAFADDALNVDGEVEVAAEAGVTAEEERVDWPRGTLRHSPRRLSGTWPREAARPRVPSI